MPGRLVVDVRGRDRTTMEVAPSTFSSTALIMRTRLCGVVHI
jgi:hypothetical protein